MADDDDPVPAETATIETMSVMCPICDETRLFYEIELYEADDGSVRVSDFYRLRRCDGCDSLIDYGAVSYRLPRDSE